MMRRSFAVSSALLVHISCAEGWITPEVYENAHNPTKRLVLGRRATDSIAPVVSAEEKSAELLSLLLDGGKAADRKFRINSLVYDLAFPSSSSPPNSYDPDRCLYGDLWCTVHTVNFANPDAPSPLWERISLRGNNVKGQQYYCDDESSGSDAEEEGCGKVINYSEIWGPAIHLSARGSFREKDEKAKGQSPGGGENSLDFDLGSMLTGWMQPGGVAWTRGRAAGRVCPDDYTVTVSKGTVSVFGLNVDIPIKGTGFLRVLYADDRMRIFISPVDTEDTDLRGDWEREGLVVVQIRSDLVSEGGSGGIDLRE